MKRIKKIIILTISSLLLNVCFFAIFPATIFARSYDHFSITPILPENQLEGGNGYYDLKMEPGQIQELPLEIYNQGDEMMVATIILQNGTTGNNATKQFSEYKEVDSSMSIPLKQVASVREATVEVPAHSQVTTYIDINMNDVHFDGVLLGGITVIANTSDEIAKEGSVSNGFSVDNRLAYTVALQMRMTDTLIEKNLNYQSTSTKLVDLKPQFISTIQNDRAVLMNNVTINGTIKNEKEKVVAKVEKVDGGILPQTSFDVVYVPDSDTIESGTYKMELTIKDESQTWTWTDEFTVVDEDANNLNEEAINFKKGSSGVLLLAIIVIIIFAILFLLFILWKNKKEKDENSR